MELQNFVHLSGHLSAEPVERILPSGDRVVSLRVVVPRAPAARRRTKQTHDVVECSVWTAKLRRTALRLAVGEDVSVDGQLRRTFRRAGGSVTSWVTVDVEHLERELAIG